MAARGSGGPTADTSLDNRSSYPLLARMNNSKTHEHDAMHFMVLLRLTMSYIYCCLCSKISITESSSCIAYPYSFCVNSSFEVRHHTSYKCSLLLARLLLCSLCQRVFRVAAKPCKRLFVVLRSLLLVLTAGGRVTLLRTGLTLWVWRLTALIWGRHLYGCVSSSVNICSNNSGSCLPMCLSASSSSNEDNFKHRNWSERG